MKKVLLVTLLYIGVCYGGTARDFTVVNADGVTLKYIVSSVDNQTLRLASNGYSGRVEVPETVVYNDTTWTVFRPRLLVWSNRRSLIACVSTRWSSPPPRPWAFPG